MRTSSLVRTASLALALLLAPAVAAAQVPSPVSIQISGTAGALVPTSSLAKAAAAGTAEDVEIGSNFAFGANVGLSLPIGFDIEAQGLLSPGADLGSFGGTSVSSDWLALTGVLLYKLPLPGISPFFGAGAGIRRHSFDNFQSLPTQLQDGLGGESESSDFTGEITVGVKLGLIPGADVRVEARDYLSSFSPVSGDGVFQNDLVLLAGLGFSFP